MVNSVYKDSIREIPLANIVEIRSARKPDRLEDYPFDSSLPYMDIKALETANPKRYTVASDFIMSKRDLVMVKDGHRSGKVFRSQEEGIAASTLVILSPKQDNVLMDYLYCYLAYCYEDFQNRKRGATVGHLDMRYLKELLIPVPDMNIQIEVAEKYKRIEALVNEMKAKAFRLKELAAVMDDNKRLKSASVKLQQQVEMIQKAWLHQIFKRTI
jgi:restriction endonuclease S subunit